MAQSTKTSAPSLKVAPTVGLSSVRERLLAAAMQLVKDEGLPGLSQARVAASAGLRQSHLTYYFPTRKDLLQAIAQTIHAGMLEALQITTAAHGEKTPSLSKLRAMFIERIREPITARMMLTLILAADEDPSLRCWLVQCEREMLDGVRATFAKLGLHPTSHAIALFHASLIGAAILNTKHNTGASAEHAEHLARLAFDQLVQTASKSDTKKIQNFSSRRSHKRSNGQSPKKGTA